jgi:hypothetical protein
LEQAFVCGSIRTASGDVPKVFASLHRRDYWGTVKARWGVGRMNYRVDPGIYALGEPDDQSPVVVTANYKMSFDCLRSALPGRDVWLLVLDTDGINVWCAAGKGTFGTEELVNRIASSGLHQLVTHRTVILPQLAAPGVAAHHVKKLSGFRVIYGPIRARDLPAFLDSGFKATAAMRCKTFSIGERLALVPVELVSALKTAAIIIPILFLLSGLRGLQDFRANAWEFGSFSAVALLGAILAGAVVTPVLLPWLPGRAFSLKGLTPGVLAALALAASRAFESAPWPNSLELFAWLLLVPAVSSYLAMNFTGASTYTSLSGVKKEMRWALPLQIAAAFIGISFWLAARFMA